MSIVFISNIASAGSSDSTPAIQNSLRVRASASPELSRTFATPTSATTWCLSWWEKRGNMPASTMCRFFATGYDELATISGDTFRLFTAGTNRASSTAVARDPTGHCHMFLVSNGTTMKLYRSNLEILSYTGTPSYFNTAVAHKIASSGGEYFDGVMSQICFVDGQALTPSAFAQYDSNYGNEWKPKTNAAIRAAVGSGGTRNGWGANGFLLDFSDITSTTTMGYDHSQSDIDTTGNNWTLTNFSLTAGTSYDALLDSPCNGTEGTRPVGNYNTFSQLWKGVVASTNNITEGGLSGSTSNLLGTTQHFDVTDANGFYAEFTVNTVGNGGPGLTPSSVAYPARGDSYGYYNSGSKWVPANSLSAYGSSFTNTDVIAIAVKGGAVWFAKQTGGTGSFTWQNSATKAEIEAGTTSHAAFTGLTGLYGLTLMCDGTTLNHSLNAGQRPFNNTDIPSGLRAICTANQGTPAIPKPKDHIDVKARAGTSATATITGLGFSPDFLWSGDRNGAHRHLQDILRNPSGVKNKELSTSNTVAEGSTNSCAWTPTSDGWTFSDGSSTWNPNNSTGSYAHIAAKLGGAGVSNTSGTISSTVSANVTAGMSAVKWTGTAANATVGHGLDDAPKFVIYKAYGTTTEWPVYHASLANTEYLALNTTAAKVTGAATYFNSLSPTSSVLNLGSSTNTNNSGGMIAYCFAEKKNFSKFGSCVGSANADGGCVFLGFKPGVVILKIASGTTGAWRMYDRNRPGYNVIGGEMDLNSNGAEGTAVEIDFLSNGFKLRTSGDPNTANTYVYAAFADVPFQYANAR